MTAAVTPTESKPLSNQGQHWLIEGVSVVKAFNTVLADLLKVRRLGSVITDQIAHSIAKVRQPLK